MTCIVVCNSGCPLNWLGKVSAHFKTCRLWGPTPDLLNWHCWQEWVSINFYKNSTLLMLKHRSWIQAAAFFIYLSWLLSHHLQWQEASWKKAPKDWMYAVNLWWPVWCVTFLCHVWCFCIFILETKVCLLIILKFLNIFHFNNCIWSLCPDTKAEFSPPGEVEHQLTVVGYEGKSLGS